MDRVKDEITVTIQKYIVLTANCSFVRTYLLLFLTLKASTTFPMKIMTIIVIMTLVIMMMTTKLMMRIKSIILITKKII